MGDADDNFGGSGGVATGVADSDVEGTGCVGGA